MTPLLARARAARRAEPRTCSDEDLALEVLRTSPAPLTAVELVELMERRGWRSPARCAGKSLGNKLCRDPRFRKVGRLVGDYGVHRWGVSS